MFYYIESYIADLCKTVSTWYNGTRHNNTTQGRTVHMINFNSIE